MTSCGVDTADDPFDSSARNSDDEDFDEDASPESSAELIRRAEGRLASQSKTDVYERRVAMREMKTIISSVRRDVGITARDDASLTRWLAASETEDTDVQFRSLFSEFQHALKEESRIDRLVQEKCRDIRTRWDGVGYYPSDELELKAKAGGKRLKRSVHLVAALDAIIDAWEDDNRPPEAIAAGSSSSSSSTRQDGAKLTDGEDVFYRHRFADVLRGLHVPDHVARMVVDNADAGPRLRSAVARASLSITEYDKLLGSIRSLGSAPPPPRGGGGAVVVRPMDLDSPDDWMESATRLSKQVKRWELVSGVPCFVEASSSLVAGVFDVTLDQTVQVSERLEDLLKRCA